MDKNSHAVKLISRFKLDCFIKINNGEELNFYRGHEYIDLGLPSGTLWATCNVGAQSETDYGNYYMYGNGSKTYNKHDKPYDGTENELPSSSDTATQVWGGGWHTPTMEQIQELISKTSYQFVANYKNSGISGGLFTAQNAYSVFFPACGFYSRGESNAIGCLGYSWSSSLEGNNGVYCFYLGRTGSGTFIGNRRLGFTVRPVLNSKLQKTIC